MTPEVVRHVDAVALASAVADALVRRLAVIQSEGRRPTLVLTGGTIAADVHRRVAGSVDSLDVDWGDVEIWFGDERYVDGWSAERNARQAYDSLLSHVDVDRRLVHEMPSADSGLPVDDAAADYARTLPDTPYDVLMLGVGPDGHCASLFPGLPQVHATGRVVGVADSPKPPPLRISMTMDELCRAQEVWFVAGGDAKADAVARALGGQTSLDETPASGPRGITRTVWFLDEEAAARL
jgi:6-phosphogluconolactonase